MSYTTISSQKKHNFSLCSCFHAHPTTLLLKILGGPMNGRSPPQILGAVPPVPPRSPPLVSAHQVWASAWSPRPPLLRLLGCMACTAAPTEQLYEVQQGAPNFSGRGPH